MAHGSSFVISIKVSGEDSVQSHLTGTRPVAVGQRGGEERTKGKENGGSLKKAEGTRLACCWITTKGAQNSSAGVDGSKYYTKSET
jgi:hypothetical protein